MKTHLSLHTNKLDESVAFYRSLLNADPHKHFDDYALFVTQEPGLELALNRTNGSLAALDHSVSHYGIAVESSDALELAIARLQDAGLAVGIEREATCCYAQQDKVWATDPDGRRWEVYYVREESDVRDGSACCTEDSCQTFATCCGS
ncbi:MAG TPA: ArsI/CadI family heavy metal resistance metalloenzyme [Candidatus Eremiobacteraceae bacterium]|nr:ArsI/CadI family heavy metal resistance metalloenzyme [Candidatus Eremiobacteraceae bacterium]